MHAVRQAGTGAAGFMGGGEWWQQFTSVSSWGFSWRGSNLGWEGATQLFLWAPGGWERLFGSKEQRTCSAEWGEREGKAGSTHQLRELLGRAVLRSGGDADKPQWVRIKPCHLTGQEGWHQKPLLPWAHSPAKQRWKEKEEAAVKAKNLVQGKGWLQENKTLQLSEMRSVPARGSWLVELLHVTSR